MNQNVLASNRVSGFLEITKQQSRCVLLAVASGEMPPEPLIDSLGIGADVENLKRIYHQFQINHEQKYGQKNDLKIKAPCFEPFYRFINEKVKAFHWVVTPGASGKPMVSFSLDSSYGSRAPCLLAIILCILHEESFTQHRLNHQHPELQGLHEQLIIDLQQAFQQAGLSRPRPHHLVELKKALLKGVEGEKVTLASPVCPDYGYLFNQGHYRYTFDSVNEGIGFVARTAINSLTILRDVLERHEIPVNVAILPGDF